MKVSIIVLALLAVLAAQSHAAPNTEEDDLQETCGENAGEFYRTKFEHGFEKGTTSYRPYYNKKLNTCFVSISIHGYRKNNVRVDSIYIVLYDLNGRKELGSLFQVYGSRSDSKFYCVTLNKPAAKCSPADWDALTQLYLQD